MPIGHSEVSDALELSQFGNIVVQKHHLVIRAYLMADCVADA